VSVRYRLVQWTRVKWAYDAVALACVAGWVRTFELVSKQTWSGSEALSGSVVAARAWGSCAFALLTVVLCIGPLARLDRRFAPLLYNRRHLGVLTFLVAAWHAKVVLGYYHGYSDVSPLESLLTWDTAVTSASLPFQLFGAAALLIFAVMAATSHDFWQRLMGPAAWKWLHMSVYAAWLLVVAHVAFGALQFDHHIGLAGMVVGSAAAVGGLHLLAARRDGGNAARELEGWLDAGPLADLADGVPKAVEVAGAERIAVLRVGEGLSALGGVCAHQGGPLTEGRVIDGCLTCPWHGWQYQPHDGCSPPPFEERLPTHRVRLVEGRVWVERSPQAPGTALEPVAVALAPDAEHRAFFVGYLPLPRELRGFVFGTVLVLAVGVGAGASAAAAWQSSPGVSERDKGVSITGVLSIDPYGVLHTWLDGEAGAVLLSRKGKYGVADKLEGFDGQAVALSGLSLQRGGVHLLEVQSKPDTVTLSPAASSALAALTPEALGPLTVQGEIVDSKCYAGRMRPGSGRGHRACAQLCIRGGIPPVLVSEQGSWVVTGPDGEPANIDVLPWVAEPVEVTGELWRTGALVQLRVDLESGIERL